MSDPAWPKKQRAARAALEYVRPGMILGVGTGSTVAALIELLGASELRLQGAVSSSERTSARLRTLGGRGEDLLARQRAPAALDQRARARGLIGSVDVERQ